LRGLTEQRGSARGASCLPVGRAASVFLRCGRPSFWRCGARLSTAAPGLASAARGLFSLHALRLRVTRLLSLNFDRTAAGFGQHAAPLPTQPPNSWRRVCTAPRRARSGGPGAAWRLAAPCGLPHKDCGGAARVRLGRKRRQQVAHALRSSHRMRWCPNSLLKGACAISPTPSRNAASALVPGGQLPSRCVIFDFAACPGDMRPPPRSKRIHRVRHCSSFSP
jgi:hypothetical protein